MRDVTLKAVQILESRFLTSAASVKNSPPPLTSEVVFLGRSNVGKSSLINALLKAPLAKSSSTPGKTQLINFFSSLWQSQGQSIPLGFIDLPGFGYAKVSKGLKKQWEDRLLEFLLERRSIKLFLHLIDSRHVDLEIDVRVSEFLQEICAKDQSIMCLYTKADKLKQNALSALQQSLQENAHICTIHTPSRKMTSMDALRYEILCHALGQKPTQEEIWTLK